MTNVMGNAQNSSKVYSGRRQSGFIVGSRVVVVVVVFGTHALASWSTAQRGTVGMATSYHPFEPVVDVPEVGCVHTLHTCIDTLDNLDSLKD